MKFDRKLMDEHYFPSLCETVPTGLESHTFLPLAEGSDSGTEIAAIDREIDHRFFFFLSSASPFSYVVVLFGLEPRRVCSVSPLSTHTNE